MDHTTRIAALKMGKAIISTHGLVGHMDKYNRDLLTREVLPDTTGLFYEFRLDPTLNGWSANNPSITLRVVYNPVSSGTRVTDEGSVVQDYTLRLSVGTESRDMDLDMCRRREAMMSLTMMLCDVLNESLPHTVTSTVSTAEEAIDARNRAAEQRVGEAIIANIGTSSLKGLRTDGNPASRRLTGAYSSATGDYPSPGTYRYRHVRRVDSRGRAKEFVHYSIRVFASSGDPPLVSIRRVSAV